MKIVIEATPKEIAALTNELQGRRGLDTVFVPETSDGPCLSGQNVIGSALTEGV